MPQYASKQTSCIYILLNIFDPVPAVKTRMVPV